MLIPFMANQNTCQIHCRCHFDSCANTAWWWRTERPFCIPWCFYCAQISISPGEHTAVRDGVYCFIRGVLFCGASCEWFKESRSEQISLTTLSMNTLHRWSNLTKEPHTGTLLGWAIAIECQNLLRTTSCAAQRTFLSNGRCPLIETLPTKHMTAVAGYRWIRPRKFAYTATHVAGRIQINICVRYFQSLW